MLEVKISPKSKKPESKHPIFLQVWPSFLTPHVPNWPLIFSSKLVLFPNYPCHCHRFLLTTQIKALVSSRLLACLSFSVSNWSPEHCFPFRASFWLTLSFHPYTWSSFLHLEPDAAACLIFLLQTTPTCSPGRQGHLASSCWASFWNAAPGMFFD